MGFQDLLATDVELLLLNASECGETVSYCPIRGVDRDIDVVLFEDQPPQVSETTAWFDNELRVVCSRSATKGIDAPRLGDVILRNAVAEPDEREYTYTGEIRNKTRNEWTLVYKRQSHVSHGTS